jgi:hypothetical protein
MLVETTCITGFVNRSMLLEKYFHSYLAADNHIRHDVSSRSSTPSLRYGGESPMYMLAT